MSLTWYDPFRSSRWLTRFPEPEDFFGQVIPREFGQLIPREFQSWLNRPFDSSWLSQLDAGAQVNFDKDKFAVNVDVQQFKPNEISVKVSDTDNTITIEGKHEERPDEHGYISRQFTRKYVLPKDHDVSKVESRLSSDGVLTITAPKIGESGERAIPITHTGQPSKPIEQKK